MRVFKVTRGFLILVNDMGKEVLKMASNDMELHTVDTISISDVWSMNPTIYGAKRQLISNHGHLFEDFKTTMFDYPIYIKWRRKLQYIPKGTNIKTCSNYSKGNVIFAMCYLEPILFNPSKQVHEVYIDGSIRVTNNNKILSTGVHHYNWNIINMQQMITTGKKSWQCPGSIITINKPVSYTDLDIIV